MGIKKIARPINKAKNKFIEWLKYHNATNIEIFEGSGSCEWDYYRSVDAFIEDKLYVVRFMMWMGIVDIEYSDESNYYNNLSVDDFLQLIS